MNQYSGAMVLLVALLMVTSVVALPMLGGELSPSADDEPDEQEAETAAGTGVADDGAGDGDEVELLSMDEVTAADAGGGAVQAQLDGDAEDAVEDGVDAGVERAQEQGVEVTQEQRDAALEAATESAAQHQDADVEQVQAATAGAVHGSLLQSQEVAVEQVQVAVGGATDGALAQHQTVEASQLQSATWGATHGALAQEQRVTVEQVQVATYGAAAGAAAEAGDKDVDEGPKIQEAAQGSAYGVLEQYQKITVEQRQQVTLEHVQHAAAGAAGGALEGSTEVALEQDQRITVEQQQRVDVKQIQKAATGAAKGALVQRQAVTVEQTQSAARGAGLGALKQVQTVDVEQIQRITITQIQEAAFGAAKGSIYQSQEATVEQIQYAADGAAGGVLVQEQEVSITQVQYAATGAAGGAIETAVQEQIVEVEQIQAASFGAGEGAVLQRQVVEVTQIQQLATGSASGALIQHQEATIEQLQYAASAACQETARVIQEQRISVTQIQILTQETASDAADYAVAEGIDDRVEISQYVEIEVEQRIETIDELEGEASITFDDQDSDGESVTVDSVDLSEGGFVAIYGGDAVADPAAVFGASDYLEPGDHEDVEIDLEETIAEDQPLVAVVHHDTTGDETFQYAETDGAEDEPYVAAGGAPVLDTAFVTVTEPDPEPEATLEVTDQDGDGETITIDEASATVDWSLTVTDGDGEERAASETFEANETETDLELELEPPLEESTTLEIELVGADGEALATESIEYTVDEPVPDPEATLTVADQTGDGESVVVEEAEADVDYVLTVSDADGEEIGASEPYAANETAEFASIDLEPPIEESTTLEVALESADDREVLDSETIEYDLEPDPAFDVAFVDCQQAEVTGSFEDGDQIIVATTFYESGGIGNTMGEYAITVGEDLEAPFEGTITYEVGDEFAVDEGDDEATVTVPPGDFGAAITGFASPEATAGEIDHPNPDGEDCIAEVRPDLPEIDVEDIEPTDDGIDVTFGYENPNDAVLLVDSTFVEGTTDDEPIDELEPGEGTFTALWTPDTDDERLVWEVDMSIYDYDEVLTAETPPAGEIDPVEPAQFTAAIADTNSPVEQGEALAVDADIENVGGEAGTQTVSLAIDGTVVDETELTLEPDATEEPTLTAETDDLEPGEYTAEVATEDETAETTVTVEAPGDPEFVPAIVETNSPVEQGDDLTVDAEIENVGEAAGAQDVSLSLDGDEVDAQSVSLEGGETETVPLVAATDDLEPGEYTAEVATEDETAETTVTIEAPGDPEFVPTIVGTNDPVEQGEQLAVDAEIENAGEGEGTQDVDLSLNGDVVDTASVSLEAGDVETVTLVADTEPFGPGEFTATVTTADATDDATVTIDQVAEPDAPAEPEEPTDPDDPFEPDEPGDPFGPDDPSEPDEPNGPAEPPGFDDDATAGLSAAE